MCSIIGSFDKDSFEELVDINQFRGNFSYSFSIYDINEKRVKEQTKGFGEFDKSLIKNAVSEPNVYYIGHLQAPTGGLLKEVNRIHPTIIEFDGDNSMCWHNGMLTSRGIKYLQKKLNTDETFDTKLLHKAIISSDYVKLLSEVEGLFSCLFYDRDLYVFRTKHGKLFVDDDMSISSERFDNSKCINYETFYRMDFKNMKLSAGDKFTTARYNIIIDGEL